MSRYGNDYGARRGRGGGYGGGGWGGGPGYGGEGPRGREGGRPGGRPAGGRARYDRNFRGGEPRHPGSEYGGYGADTGWSAWENPGGGPGPRRGYDRGWEGGRGGPGRR